MTPEAVKAAAAELAAARRSNQRLPGLTPANRPASHDEGYAIQRAFIAAWPDKVAGWKSGATAPAVQQRFSLTEPFLGAIFAATVLQSPARLKAVDYEHRGPLLGQGKPAVALEVEFAYRVARDLAPKAGGYSEGEALEAMDAMIPAFEIISPRFHAIPFDYPGSALADCGVNGGIVLGAPVTNWRSIDYAGHTTRHLTNGKVITEGTGALVLGHPFKSLHWLVNGVGRQGFTLSKGQVLTTGSMSGIVYVEAGAEAVADFGTLGRVVVTIE